MSSKVGRSFLGMLVAASTLLGAFGLASAASPSASAQSSEAKLRVIHASPDAPAVDIYVNGSKAISNLAFKDVSPWASLPAGTYDVKVTAAGGTDAVIQANLPLEGGKYYSVVATGKLANITAKVFTDDFSPLDAGKARLRVVHASPDAPAVDVAVTGGPVLVPNLAFPDASGNLAVDAGTYDVEVRAAGTTTAALSTPGLALEAGKLYTVYAVGLLGGTPALSLLPVVDTVPAAAMGPAPTGMPATGAGDGIFPAVVLALILLASISVTAGVLVRVRNR